MPETTLRTTTSVFGALLLALALNLPAEALDTGGKVAGESAGNLVINNYGSKAGLDALAHDPMTDSSTPYRDLTGNVIGYAPAFCGQDSVKNEFQILQVTVNPTSPTGTLLVRTDTNADGIFDTTFTFDFIYVCKDGIARPGLIYENWMVSSTGTVGTVPAAGPLDGCITAESAPPTYVGGAISEQFARNTGFPIIRSNTTGDSVTYYTGQVKDCTGANKDISSTRYYDNPYAMENDASNLMFTYGASCGDNADCRAYNSLYDAQTNIGATTTGALPCSMEVLDAFPFSIPDHDEFPCEANRVYYPEGYSPSKPICYRDATSYWNYNSRIAFQCDRYGKSLHVTGWAFWEGAPCGVTANYPPANQLTGNDARIIYGQDYFSHKVGQFHVNYRMEGPNTTHNDMGNTNCYSDALPLNVIIQGTSCDPELTFCTYSLLIENAPSCSGPYVITVEPPPQFDIRDDCTAYESEMNCSLKEEVAYDADLITQHQTVRDGSATNDRWNPTCKTFPIIGTVCREWWKKERVYQCENVPPSNPDMQLATSVMDTAQTTSDNLRITYSALSSKGDLCTSGDCQIDVFKAEDISGQDCEISCLIKAPASPPVGNSQNDYVVRACAKTFGGYICPINAGETMIQNCGCTDTFGLSVGVVGSIYESTRDRFCSN
jgi:hypothetical protein